MPPENATRLDPGKMYFNTPEGFNHLPHIYEVEEEHEEEPTLWPKENPYIKTADAVVFNAEIPLAEETQVEALRNLTATAEAAMRVFKQVMEVVKKMLDSCTNRRVLHLATHGSPRVRKKNVKRLVRMYKKMRKD